MGLSSEAELRRFAAANNEFTVGLYQELRKNDGNLFFSPYSIRSALIRAYAGSRGRTAAQMAEVLRLPASDPDAFRACREIETEIVSHAKPGAIEISAASALWRQADLPLLPPFVELMRDAFGAKFLEADFKGSPGEAARAINAWVKAHTRGRIAMLIGPHNIGPLTRLVLTSAIFFQGRWALPFPPSLTRSAPFRLPRSTETVQVAMMHLEEDFKYAPLDGFQIAEFPYLGSEMAMAVLLPDARDGWIDLEERLSAMELSRWLRGLQAVRIDVSLPKFQIGSSFGLEQELGRMGMRDAFDPGSADFSGMTLEKPFGINAITHAARVEVDEAGTLAAAATEISLALCMKPIFRADHPFLFVIRDIPTETILFIGRVLEPEWNVDEAGQATTTRLWARLLRALGLK